MVDGEHSSVSPPYIEWDSAGVWKGRTECVCRDERQ